MTCFCVLEMLRFTPRKLRVEYAGAIYDGLIRKDRRTNKSGAISSFDHRPSTESRWIGQVGAAQEEGGWWAGEATECANCRMSRSDPKLTLFSGIRRYAAR